MAPPSHSRNNARKAAARAAQRAHPGMSYLDALAKVSHAAGQSDNPLNVATLLGIASAADIRARYARAITTPDLAVPVGISDIQDPVSIDLNAIGAVTNAAGPHGMITGPGALTFALTLATALRAANPPNRLQVVAVGSEQDCRAAENHVDETFITSISTPTAQSTTNTTVSELAPSQGWQAWIADEFDKRAQLTRTAGLRDLLASDKVPQLVVIIAANGFPSHEEKATIEHIVRCGRALGVHGIIATETSVPQEVYRTGTDATPLGLEITFNLTFHISLPPAGPTTAAAVLQTGPTGPYYKHPLTFSPAVVDDDSISEWTAAARRLQ